MKKLNAILLGIVLFLPLIFAGCQNGADITGGVEVVSVQLEDWKNPKDGQIYLVAIPTWKNGGKDAIRQVYFLADIKDTDFKLEEPKEPQFYGAIVEPGTTVKPNRIPEDGVVLGVKEELEKKYGAIDVGRVEVSGLGSPEEFKPEHKTDA